MLKAGSWNSLTTPSWGSRLERQYFGKGSGPRREEQEFLTAHGSLSTNAHFSLLMASSAFLPLKLGEDRMRVTPCSTHTMVPATEPRQWYRGQGRTTRNS